MSLHLDSSKRPSPAERDVNKYLFEHLIRGEAAFVTTGAPPEAIDAVRQTLRTVAPDAELRPTSITALNTHPKYQSLRAVIIATTACGRCSLRLFDAAHWALAPAGICIVFGPVADPRDQSQRDWKGSRAGQVPVWSYLVKQAQRRGFDFLAVDRVGDEKGIPPRGSAFMRPRLVDEWNIVAAFRKAEQAPRWRLSTVGMGESAEMRALFNEVFVPDEMSAQHWRWKYGEGRAVAVGAWSGGALVAHYGGVWRDVYLTGQLTRAVQITDVMVSARHRGILRRDAAFSMVAASFPECYTGYGAEALIGFGFPNERHFRAASLRNLYAEVDRMLEITWPQVDADRSLRHRRAVRLERLSVASVVQSASRIDRLWSAMRRSFEASIIGVRDSQYILHRYINNPIHSYHFVVLRGARFGRWLALAILSQEAESVQLRDIIGHNRHFQPLIDALRHSSMLDGKPLTAWVTASHAALLSNTGGNERDLGIVIPHSVWTAGPPVHAIKNRWWLTSGDTDFL